MTSLRPPAVREGGSRPPANVACGHTDTHEHEHQANNGFRHPTPGRLGGHFVGSEARAAYEGQGAMEYIGGPMRCESGVLRAWAGVNESASRARCAYGPVQSLGPIVNSAAFDGSPTVSADDTELLFTSEREGLLDLFVSTHPNRGAAWTAPVHLGPPVDDPSAGDFSLRLSSDGNTLYFHRLATAVLARPISMLRRALRSSIRGARPPISGHGSTRTRSKHFRRRPQTARCCTSTDRRRSMVRTLTSG